jgi:hypothetical protein
VVLPPWLSPQTGPALTRGGRSGPKARDIERSLGTNYLPPFQGGCAIWSYQGRKLSALAESYHPFGIRNSPFGTEARQIPHYPITGMGDAGFGMLTRGNFNLADKDGLQRRRLLSQANRG